MENKLYRSRTDKQIMGVCGGLAKHLGIDSTIIRIAWAFCVLFAGAGVLAYVICALIIPEEPIQLEKEQEQKGTGQ